MKETPSSDRTLRLAPYVTVVVRQDELHLGHAMNAPKLTVALPEILVLAALAVDTPATVGEIVASAVAESGGSSSGLDAFVQRLERRGYAHEGDRVRPQLGHGDTVTRAENGAAGVTGGICLSTPLVASVRDRSFHLVDHDGRSLVLTPIEMFALGSLTRPTRVEDAYDSHRAAAGGIALERHEFESLIATLDATGHLSHVPDSELVLPDDADATRWVDTHVKRDRATVTLGIPEEQKRLAAAIRRRAIEHEDAERAREVATRRKRTKVVPVAFDPGPPLGLGLIIANAKAYKGGLLEEFYDFRLDWVFDEERIPSYTERPSVFLFSNYLWSHKHCIDVSEAVKKLSPASVTIHGGPDTPKYESDVETYFAAHPHVDITVRGEGEAATAEVLEALSAVMGDPEPDLSVLANVPGIYYRDGDRIVRTADRERMSDLNQVPSPFLMGLFDAYAEVGGAKVTIETNRGCPYGCTFCDWGSATLSRIRKYDLDRVFAELEWCAKARALSVGPADANFGIFERDVQIAERIAELKQQYGYPEMFGVSYAKNTVKHLQHIIQTLANAGIMTQGIMSLQTMDEDVLDAVHRSNIKTEKYDALAVEFRKAKLPLFVDLMLGLPGSTPATFMGDLQQCVDREVQVRIPRTTLLVNSPMNEPAYREQYQIETSVPIAPGNTSYVISTSTFTREQYKEMTRLRLLFLLFENFGALRQVARFVRQSTGRGEVYFYEQLRADAEREPGRWPALYTTASVVPSTMCPPVSWKLFIDEVKQYTIEVLGLPDDSALEAVLTVQHALLPSFGRQLPEVLELKHDVGAWHADVLAVKEGPDRNDWPSLVPPLSQYPPGQFAIDDPNGLVRNSIGCNIEFHGFGLNWEYESPVRRAFLARENRFESLASSGL